MSKFLTRYRRFSAVLCATLGCSMPDALAATDTRMVYSPSGRAVFEVVFLDKDEPPIFSDSTPPDWSLDEQQKGKVLQAMRQWAEILQPNPQADPARIHVGTFGEWNNPKDSDVNASGGSQFASSGEGGTAASWLWIALAGDENPNKSPAEPDAYFAMGLMKFDQLNPWVPSQVPRDSGGAVDLVAVAFHELAHGLGIISTLAKNQAPGGPPLRAHDHLTAWGQGLRDDNGRPLGPGQAVLCPDRFTECNVGVDPDTAFDLRKNQGYFKGRHVADVLQGAMPGVPVSLLTDDGGIDGDFLGHIELKNGLMSHQTYRNYTTFMEAELAVLQDMGYAIDRRNFFGRSIYGDGATIDNRQGFFLRQDGRDVPGRYNTATLGLGLHIYGSRNTVTQWADLLSAGAGGAGVRIDGASNTLIIPQGTQVHAQGLNGRGLLFAYGTNHQLALRGDVQALGEGGIGVAFDFGSPALGLTTLPNSEKRGSYIYEIFGAGPASPPPALLPELNGALVSRFDLSGRVAGRAAAIYLSDNALVDRISILRGARVQGDIVSRYQETDAGGALRLTRLDFGRLADGLGRSTDQADAGFDFRHDGNITGRNLSLTLYGGKTSLNGIHSVDGVTVREGARLSGNATYQGLDAGGLTTALAQGFVNHGTVAPGNSLGAIVIDGAYTQGPTGVLDLEFNGQGDTDVLRVKGLATLDGTLQFQPLADWYASGWSSDASKALAFDGGFAGQFAAVDLKNPSPTLDFQVQTLGPAQFVLRANRAADAYRRLARGSNAAGVGAALDRLAGRNAADLRPLFAGLDFSGTAANVDAGLRALSPEAYSALYGLALERESQIDAALQAPVRAPGRPDDAWQGFAASFGGLSDNDADTRRVGYRGQSYGLVLGGEGAGWGDGEWLAGVHATAAEQSLRTDTLHNASGRLSAFGLGLHARHLPARGIGPEARAWVRAGLEHGSLTRRVRIGQYAARHEASWTSPYVQAGAQLAYRWPVTSTLALGPLAGLDYTHLQRSGLEESGDPGSRLSMDASGHQALRSRLGVGMDWRLQSGRHHWDAQASVAWQHDLLQRDAVQTAGFSGHPDADFTTRNVVGVRDAAILRAGLRYARDDRLAFSLAVSSTLAGSQRTLDGSLRMDWRF